jgi:hypothetical protein
VIGLSEITKAADKYADILQAEADADADRACETANAPK